MGLRSIFAAIVLVAAAVPVCAGPALAAEATERPSMPTFKVDPEWPKLPDGMLLGDVSGVAIDEKDHVWVLHRPRTINPQVLTAASDPPKAECCVAAPPVLEFDADGNFIRGWGGPAEGYQWPLTEHSIHVDHKGYVWISSGKGDAPQSEAQILKFTRDGKFVMQIGRQGESKGSNDTENVHSATEMFVDAATNELYVADGYYNRRVIVFDAETGKAKRYWGAYGAKPDDSAPRVTGGSGEGPKQFNVVHGLALSKDGLLYVCDRRNNRMQIFTKDGKFVTEFYVARNTTSYGTVFSVAFSADPEQKYMYIPDASNGKIHIFDRKSLKELGTFGRWGNRSGQWMLVHSVAVDSKGNLYTTEANLGQRVQKFLFTGVAPAPASK